MVVMDGLFDSHIGGSSTVTMFDSSSLIYECLSAIRHSFILMCHRRRSSDVTAQVPGLVVFLAAAAQAAGVLSILKWKLERKKICQCSAVLYELREALLYKEK
jgi:hypothetical protein